MKVYSKNGNANVRKEPSITSVAVGTISTTNGLEYIGDVKDKVNVTWYKVKGGYVRNDVAVIREDHKYKDVMFDGYVFPDASIQSNLNVTFSKEMKNEYIPTVEKIEAGKGVKLLATVMAQKEGFYSGTRSYKNNNPGNIGNTDSGANVKYPSLKAGIDKQIEYISGIATGKNSAHKFGLRTIKPYYSSEIAKNQKVYGIDPYLPGYKFDYKGQLGAFVKIYSTGARAGNGYLSQIISYFSKNGIEINQHTTISEIVAIK